MEHHAESLLASPPGDGDEQDPMTMPHACYQTGRYLPHKRPKHNRWCWTSSESRAKACFPGQCNGPFGLMSQGRETAGSGMTLPFLVSDMVDFRVNGFMIMPGAQRLNLDRLCPIALFLFRVTLEDREHNRASALADICWYDCPDVMRQSGIPSTEWEIAQQPQSGFTPCRWMFWLNRFVRQRPKQVRQETNYSRRLLQRSLREWELALLWTYEIGGPALHQDKDLLRLEELLNRSEGDTDNGKEDSESTVGKDASA
ncbi:hypothetical protein BDV10DRAFT_196310 [Aspergillus recurvatus]